MTNSISIKRKPVLIDLFCGGGCGAYGYISAGFFVIGIDVAPGKHYPGLSHSMDWKEGVKRYTSIASAFHASPECQGYSKLKGLCKSVHKQEIPDVRHVLESTGKPYIIENVPGSPLRNFIKLNGVMFGLKCLKERWFESNCLLLAPERVPVKGRCHIPRYGVGPTGYVSVVGDNFNNAQGHSAMQVKGKMSNYHLAQGFPPAYSAYIGRQLIHYC